MKQARYRYRCYPTSEQASALARQFGCNRYVWNWALAAKRDAYADDKTNVSMAQLSSRLTQLKKQEETSWLSEVGSQVLQQSLRQLDVAYNNFFSKRGRFPRFKRKGNAGAATYAAQSYRLSGDLSRPSVKLAKQKGPLKIRWTRPLPSPPSSLTIVRDPDGRYYISFVVKINPKPLPKTKAAVGIDLGLTDIYVTSDASKSGNPRHTKRTEVKLAKAQRLLSRKTWGSSRWHRQRRRVASLHRQIRSQRSDFLHKASLNLVRNYDVIAVEDLNVRGMVLNPSLSKAISDAGWGEFVRQLAYKADWYGKTLTKVDRWYPSTKTCSNCGHVVSKMKLDVRCWRCPTCKTSHDRDVNAAKNIVTVGLAGLKTNVESE